MTICGAGVHGISVALRCQRQGIPYTILERDTDLSGTWHQNIYPGTVVLDGEDVFNKYLKVT